ncbi:hypothetical protein NDU88_003239 [Pleurodeles waltl]|uniref:Uncharacterized protein n=1 Tax=Pleurodeles waltl TaxID=8319 RepID=A0AAV7W6T7_PLEWA|nr:hypothetical protein NDU88_003239 [Pleurodeles waltl]
MKAVGSTRREANWESDPEPGATVQRGRETAAGSREARGAQHRRRRLVPGATRRRFEILEHRDDVPRERGCPSRGRLEKAVVLLPHMLHHTMAKDKELKPPKQGKIEKYTKAMGSPARADSFVQLPDMADLLLAIQQSRTALETKVD